MGHDVPNKFEEQLNALSAKIFGSINKNHIMVENYQRINALELAPGEGRLTTLFLDEFRIKYYGDGLGKNNRIKLDLCDISNERLSKNVTDQYNEFPFLKIATHT